MLFQDRKLIMKSMKTFILKICKEEYGHMVLLALFDVVDDTKMVSKVILEVNSLWKRIVQAAIKNPNRLFYFTTNPVLLPRNDFSKLCCM